MPQPPALSHWINGEHLRSQTTVWIDSLNPSTPDERVASAPVGNLDEVDQAVQAAHQASVAWKDSPAASRATCLLQWSDAIQSRSEEFAQAVAREVGKPVTEARGEVSRAVALLRYFAGEAVRPVGDVIPAQTAESLQFSLRVPLGVVGLITPWNFPLAIPLWKAAPALAMGNTVVLKPSELSSQCTNLLVETIAHFPPGVINVVYGDGSTGEQIANHHLVNAISFTGSAGVGAKIQVACAKRNVKCQTEMGGKNAAVVLEDADLVRAAALVAGGAMRFAGQKCTATSRVIIHQTVWDAFIRELSGAIEKLAIGSVFESATALGPVISESAAARLYQTLEDSKSRILFQSEVESNGYYVPPTVLGPIQSKEVVAQQELFGPILVAIRAIGLDEAISIANDSEFGLSTAVYTKDIAHALTFANQVEAGLVRINGDTTGVDLHAPFGGLKGSSSGSREQGEVAKDFYTEWKTIQINP